MKNNLENNNLNKKKSVNSKNVESRKIDDSVEFILDIEDEISIPKQKNVKSDNEIVEKNKKPKPSKPKPVLDNTLYKSSINDGKYKIMVIDDDKWIVRLFKQYLSQWGFTIISAINPFQAMNEAIHHKPLGIFLDILIPEVDGDTLLKFLKRSEITTDIPVVIISGNLNKNIIKSTYLSGASGFLTKPLSQDTLYNKICEILDDDIYDKMISEGLLVNKSTQQE